MKSIYLVLYVLFVTTALFAYQNNGLGLVTPTSLYEDEAELSICHRFYGAIDKDIWDTFFGMNNGANIRLAYRQSLIYNIELKTAYEREQKRYEAGTSFRFTPFETFVQAQLDLSYISFIDPGAAQRKKNFVYLLSVQNKVFRNRFSISTNIGFDAYYERLISGIGLSIILLDKMTLIGEYYPVWDRNSAANDLKELLGRYDAFAIGLRFETEGHHFVFLVSNSVAVNPFDLSIGTDQSRLGFGFNIQRKLRY